MFCISIICIIFANPIFKQKETYKRRTMTKAEIVAKIADKTGLDKKDVLAVVEHFVDEVKNSLASNENVYLRGFGSFINKYRAEKVGRNISKNTSIKIPAHYIPAFKPSKTFVNKIKENVKP